MAAASAQLMCPSCGKRFPAETATCPEHKVRLVADDPAVGRLLSNRYKLVRLLGHGGMGSVYEGVHALTDKRVAVKLLAGHLSKDLKLVARFRREALAASRLDHENCVHVDDFGEDGDGTFFIVMEFVDGQGIADELKRSGPMSTDRVARIAEQLLKALDAAHNGGVLHRDLKPQNVMLMQRPGRPDIVKVVDFGIAKITTSSAEDQAALTVPGTIFGTPEYMSPEQARGEVLDVRSDIYSAGVVLWHMLLGRSPFRGTSVRDTLVKVFSEDPPLPSSERPTAGIPADFEEILLRAVAKRKEERFPDAGTFLQALAPYVKERSSGLVPRLPMPGLPKDGSAPPETLSDEASAKTMASFDAAASTVGPKPAPPVRVDPAVTTAIPNAEPSTLVASVTRMDQDLPPLATPGEPGGAPVGALPAARKGPVSDPVVRPLRGLAPARRASPVPVYLFVGSLFVLGLAAFSVAGFYGVRALQTGRGQVVDVHQPDPPKKPPDTRLPREPVPPPSNDPLARDAALSRAARALEEGRVKDARTAYEQALAADVKSIAAQQGLAILAFQQGDYVTAKVMFEMLMAQDEKYRRQFAPFYKIVEQSFQKSIRETRP